MFDYRLDEEKNDIEYITNYYINRDNPNELLVKFADMDDYLVIDNSYENIEKLDKIMEEQIIKAIENRKELKRLGNTIKLGEIGSIITGLFLGSSNVLNGDINKLIGTCLFSIVIPFLGGIVWVDYDKKVEEIDKAKFLLENMDLLMAYEEYSLPLIGVSKECRRYLRGNDDPFKMNDLDSFSIKDLKKMVHNMRKEDNFGFTYKKKYKR